MSLVESYQIDPNIPTNRTVTDGADFQVTFSWKKDNADDSIPILDSEKKNLPPSKQRVCKYFRLNGKCKDGSHCKYAHCETTSCPTPIDNTELTETNQDNKTLPKVKQRTETGPLPDKQKNDCKVKNNSKKSCPYFEAPSGCRNGEKCKFQHYRATVDAGEQDLPPMNNETADSKEKDSLIHGIELQQEKHRDNFIHNQTHHYRREKQNKQSNGCDENSKDDHLNSKSTVQCRYYMQGRCNSKEKCRFLHDDIVLLKRSDTTITKKTSQNDDDVQEEIAIDGVVHGGGDIIDNCAVLDTPPHHNSNQASGICRYYNSDKGCKRVNCRFQHTYNDGILDAKKNVKIPDEDFKVNVENENNNQVEAINTSNGNEQNKEINSTRQKQNDARARRRLIKCRYGEKCFKKESCPFMHEDITNKENQRTICQFFLSSKGCINGDSCPNTHSVVIDKSSSDTVTREADFSKLRTTEMLQLEKRFSGGKCSLHVKEPNTIYYVTITPTDPDWPFVVKDFELIVDFPEDYPKQLFKVTLQNHESSPPLFTRFMNAKLDEWHEGRLKVRKNDHLDFRPFLKWFDRNLMKMFRDSATKVKLHNDAEKGGIQLIRHDHILTQQASAAHQTTGTSNEHEETGASDEHQDGTADVRNKTRDVSEKQTEYKAVGDSENDSVPDQNYAPREEVGVINDLFITENQTGKDEGGVSSGKVKQGTEIKFPNLFLSKHVGTMIVKGALLTVECTRCKERNDFKVQSQRRENGTCQRCGVAHSVTYRSNFIHHNSPVAGHLQMEGCKAFDFILNESTIVLNCLNCSKDNQLKGMTLGSKKDHWCQSCNEKIEIHAERVKFTVIGPSGVVTRKNDSAGNVTKKKITKEPGIRAGEPLPDNGSCKHYKKSFRWLRFPCCGKVYPCDDCHNSKEDHECEFAKKMICGFCAKEQPFFKDKPCIACKNSVTKANSTHWEGGKGCRDKSKMARNDKRKTAGEGKTISRNKAN